MLPFKYIGRRQGQTSGTHLDNLAQLGKCIVLCMMCEPKFNRRVYAYERAADLPVVRGECDGCGEHVGCAAFLRKRKD